MDVDETMKDFNPCLDLLVFLSSVLDTEITNQQAVGLTLFGRNLTAKDYPQNQWTPGKSLIARFCHSVVEPFYEDVMITHKDFRRSTMKEQKWKTIIRKDLAAMYHGCLEKNRPLRIIQWRHHVLYFGKGKSVPYKPTVPRRLLKCLRYLVPKIRGLRK